MEKVMKNGIILSQGSFKLLKNTEKDNCVAATWQHHATPLSNVSSIRF